jgi:hypothetical protein
MQMAAATRPVMAARLAQSTSMTTLLAVGPRSESQRYQRFLSSPMREASYKTGDNAAVT